jgi:hypothetical protein
MRTFLQPSTPAGSRERDPIVEPHPYTTAGTGHTAGCSWRGDPVPKIGGSGGGGGPFEPRDEVAPSGLDLAPRLKANELLDTMVEVAS